MSDLLNTPASYGDDAIVTLTPREHIRLRPGMYIGKLGDGSQPDDGIYVLIKEVVDNSVDEFIMGAGKQIEITVADNVVTVRDYGRGIPLKSLAAAVSEMNTGGKYGGTAFKKTVGLNGVGVKAVNMLSSEFTARSVRDGEARTVTFAQGIEQSDRWESGVEERNGTLISFRVDEEVFGAYAYNMEYVEEMVKNYTYLNLGLTFKLNGQSYVSKNGLLDLLNEKMSDAPLYAPIHLSGDDIEVAITHGSGYGESYYSFVNGQYTSQGGTHQAAFREAIAKTVKEFYHKDYDASDIRTSIIAAISVKVTDPVFESQTKIKLGSKEIEPGVSMRNFVLDFIGKHLDDYLHKHAETAQVLQKKIVENEKERKAISGIQKKARETAKKVSLNNKKLRDCKIHLTDRNDMFAGWTETSVPGMLNGDDHYAYIQGYSDGSVRPNANITRAQVATIFFRLLDENVRDDNLTTSNAFPDVNEDYWANTAISTMARLGVINGRNSGLFDPDANITRAEFAAICARFDDSGVAGVTTFTDTADHWAEDEISRAAALGWIQGYSDDSFRPDQYISRAQAVTMINRVLCRLPEDTDDLLSGMNTWTDCHESDWFYLAIQEATNSHDFVTKDRVYESWTDLNRAPDWSRYE